MKIERIMRAGLLIKKKAGFPPTPWHGYPLHGARGTGTHGDPCDWWGTLSKGVHARDLGTQWSGLRPMARVPMALELFNRHLDSWTFQLVLKSRCLMRSVSKGLGV